MKSLLDSECVSSMVLSRPQYHTCILVVTQGPTSSAFGVIHVGAQTVLPLPGNAPARCCLTRLFLWLSDHHPGLPGMVLVNPCCPHITRAPVWMKGHMVSIVMDSSGPNNRGQLGAAGWLETHQVWGCLAWAQVLTRSLTGSQSHQWSLSLYVLAYNPQSAHASWVLRKSLLRSCFSF